MTSENKMLKQLILLLIITIFLVVLFVMNLFFGSVTLHLGDVWEVLTKQASASDPVKWAIIMQFRMPQALTAMLAGSGLAVAGLLLQTLFRNPLADPSILGISSGASLGVALLVLGFGAASGYAADFSGWLGHIGIVMASFSGAMLILLLITFLGRHLSNTVSLLIAGIMIAYMAGALVGIAKYFSQKEDLQAFVLWGMGSFSNVGPNQLIFLSGGTLAGLMYSFFLIKPLNMLLLGERYAANLGLNVRRTKVIILFLSGFLTAVITAYTGPIAFLGLAVPHLARNIFRNSNHIVLVPASVLLGAALALFCNLVARLPGFDTSLPINAVTSLIGAPIVVWIIMKRQHLYTSSN